MVVLLLYQRKSSHAWPWEEFACLLASAWPVKTAAPPDVSPESLGGFRRLLMVRGRVKRQTQSDLRTAPLTDPTWSRFDSFKDAQI